MYRSKICPICNEEFIPKSAKQKYCKKIIHKRCIVCGDTFQSECSPDSADVCAKAECKKQSAQTHVLNKPKKCLICGDMFYPTSARQKYCKKEVIRICPVCGESFKSQCTAEYNKCCSDECKIKYAKQKSTEGMQKNVKICKFCGEKFHPKTNTQVMCDKIHYRTCAVCGKKFEISRKSNLCDIPITCSKECKSVLSHQLSDESISRRESNMRKTRYADRPEQLKSYEDFLANPTEFIKKTYVEQPTIDMLGETLGLHNTSTGQLIHRLHIEHLIGHNLSNMEAEVITYIKEIQPNIRIIQHDRTLINPLELDIYLPEYKLAIECNPTGTHNSSVSYRNDPPKPIRYHQMKTNMCEEKGVFLLHVFGYEWEHKKDVMKSIIANLIHANTHTIYARKCKVVNIDGTTCKNFLDQYHRQGNANSSTRYGLTFNHELVAVMTFSKPRTTIKANKFNSNENCYELVRFCSKSDYNIVGGASKLFKHFIKEMNPETVYSYSDRAHTKGTLYSNLNFKEISRSDPGYVWVNLNTNIAYNRVNTQKQNIKKFLNDDTIDLSKSETEIMEAHRYVKVYDSGVITWEWVKQSL